MKTTLLLFGILAATLSLHAENFSYTDYIKVDHSQAVHKQVTQRIPYQECWDEHVPVYRDERRHSSQEGMVGSIIGGVAGGVLGHQIGKGRGNDAATIGGAIIGTLVGHNLSNRALTKEVVTYQPQRQCVTKYKKIREEKLIGYKNIGWYKGEKIVKFSEHKLHRIPVTVTIHY